MPTVKRTKSTTPYMPMQAPMIDAMERTALRNEARSLLESVIGKATKPQIQLLIATLEQIQDSQP